MAVYTDINGKEEVLYEGCVLNWFEHNGYHDSDWYAEVWDEETGSVELVEYMTTRCGCFGKAEVDATPDVLRKAYRYYKGVAKPWFERYNVEQAKKIRKGDTVRIVKGRKVKKGSVVKVFWAGTVYNRYSRMEEDRIGVEVDGERVFISAENAEPVGWEDRMIHGRERKALIRNKAISLMPFASRHIFQKTMQKSLILHAGIV